MNKIFEIKKKSKEASLARAGIIHTPHGDILTPAFIPVGTKATVKSLTPEQIEKYISPEAVLANTYHLYLEPGQEIVKSHGGFAKMMGWQSPLSPPEGGRKPKPTFTDSGGFQVFSLGQAMGHGVSKIATSDEVSRYEAENTQKDILNNEQKNKNIFLKTIFNFFSNAKKDLKNKKLAKIDDDGVTFKSYIDGSRHRFTPERSMQIQHDLGADIFFAFDECTSPLAPHSYQIEAMNRTHSWAERCLREHMRLGKSQATNEQQYLFAVVQGGAYQDLRKESAKILANMKIEASPSTSSGGEQNQIAASKMFDGFGIGGSFTKDDIGTAVKWVTEELNKNDAEEKPRHLLGIGEPIDIFLGVENGIDTFDCVSPTRIGRNGRLYTFNGPINILNAKYKFDMSPACEDPSCYAHNYTKSYLHHLFRSKEMLAATIASVHNLHFIVNLTKNIRKSLIDDNFFEYKKEFCDKYYKNKE